MEKKSVCGMIMAVLLAQRVNSAVEVQNVLTKHGCMIRMRLGLHETSKDYCAEDGLILLQLCGLPEEYAALAAELSALAGVRVKTLSLED
jgi:hypothetical protein